MIAGPASIVVADSMLGEITPKMAAAIGQSEAEKVLIPLNRCGILIAGVQECPVDELIEKAAGDDPEADRLIQNSGCSRNLTSYRKQKKRMRKSRRFPSGRALLFLSRSKQR